MTSHRHGITALAMACIMASTTGCLRPSEEQVDLDRTVGQAAIAGVDITIAGGLAAVQQLAPEAMTLWAGAPGFEGTLTLGDGAAATWTITLRNILPDGVLTIGGAPVEPMSRPAPTEAVYRLALPAGAHALRFSEPAAPDGAWRFAVLSDVQDAIDEADDIIDLLNARDDIRFLLSAGDLTEQGEADEYQRYVDTFARLEVPYYSTPGNHERGAAASNWTRYFGRANHSWPYRGARFTFVDSSYGTLDPTVYDWLDGWLAQGHGVVHVVATHIPIMDPIGTRGGQFRSRNEAGKLLVKLARGEVDLTLFGHVHSYYAFSLAGIPANISGGGGALPERLDGIDRHFLVVTVDDAIDGVELVRVD